MTARQVRREQERKQRKLGYEAAKADARERLDSHAESQSSSAVIACDEPAAAALDFRAEAGPTSLARSVANRVNAQSSTGPRTESGKAKSSLNAVKTALTGRTVLLPSDDADEYESHLLSYDKELRPIGSRECALVQFLADTDWRLNRIPILEFAIYARGRCEFATRFDDHDAELRPGLIELETFLTYEKQLRNLQVQEDRLRRHREKAAAELRQLQSEREAREKRDLDIAAKLYTAARKDRKPFDPVDHGFEFSKEEIESYLDGVRAAIITRETLHRDAHSILNSSAA